LYVNDTSTSNAATATTPPAAPVFTLSTVSNLQLDVSWNTVAGATAYLVDEFTNGNWVQVGDLGSTGERLPVSEC
jgi:hypothetical protein